MTDLELMLLLRRLLSLPHETEWVEFKHNNADPEEIGEYLSALANSAAFNHQVAGFLVWGIDDATRRVIGTNFQPRARKIGNEELENWLLRLLTPRIDFRIHEFTIGEHPVVIFEVMPTNHTPVRWKDAEFIRVGSYKKKLRDFPEKERELWRMLSEPQHDWSAAECHGATLNDLDPQAIAFARTQYKVKTPALANEVDQWGRLDVSQ